MHIINEPFFRLPWLVETLLTILQLVTANEHHINEEDSDEKFYENADDVGDVVDDKDAGRKPHNEIDVNENLHKIIKGQHRMEYVGHGDIMFRKGEEKAVFGHTSQALGDEVLDEQYQDAVRNINKRWKLPIPYQIEPSLTSSARSAVKQAIAEYATKTCIRFRHRKTGDRSYMSFYKGSGCWSYVGRSGGGQRISLGDGCQYKKTAIHEIMHALGFYHEQSRPDRDRYVTINLHNIQNKDRYICAPTCLALTQADLRSIYGTKWVGNTTSKEFEPENLKLKV
ncbi:blastula protease 10-like [Hydractinia symbiolongicarpus]|uniref:blastula protease 10-like n=1 Tax=Hydractinia symbiolongicarpus TaxID=13093 RepID=UPI00254AAC68|nr:blastula protease 10-like [Hydractinia symbiolongicarpus]